MSRIAFVLLCLLACCSWNVNVAKAQLAGQCEVFAGEPPECTAVLDANAMIFVPLGFSQEALASTIIPSISAIRLAPAACRHPIIQALCGATFRNCTENLLPQPPCKSICEDAHANCPPEAVATLDCEQADPFLVGTPLEGLPLFPETGWVLPTGDPSNPTFLLPCTSLNDPASIPVSTCPPTQECCVEPFAQDPDTGECALMCTIPVFSHNTQNVVMYVFSALGYVNTITAVVIGFLYLKEPYRRKYPKTLPIIMMFMAWSFTFSASWSLMKGSDVDDWNCIDAVTPVDGRTPRCAAQGFFTHLGVYTTTTWIFLIALNMALVVWEVIVKKIVIYGILIVIGIVLPLVSAIIAVSAGVYETVFYFCFLPHTELYNSMGWTDGLLMVPVTIFVAATFVCYVLICVRLFRVAGLEGFRSNWRLLALVLYLLTTLFIWVLWYWVDIRARMSSILDSFEQYAFCVALAPELEPECYNLYNGPSLAWAIIMLSFTFGFCLFTSLLVGWSDRRVICGPCGATPYTHDSSHGPSLGSAHGARSSSTSKGSGDSTTA